jgi:surfeit locus 1 family protein
MIFGEYRFQFRWVPTLLLALPVPLFAALGLWQMDRAEQKRVQAETLRQRSEQAPLRLPAQQPPSGDAVRFRHIVARGHFEATDQFYIENRRHAGRTGFHVITPLRLQGSDTRVLVNRGWIESAAPQQLPAAPIPDGILEVSGTASIPSAPALALHDGGAAAIAWGKRWPYMTVDLFAATVEYPLAPFIILQNAQDPGGFARQWPKELPKEGMHLGYAIQWFAFAAISLGFYLKLSLARSKPTEHNA